MKIKYKIKIKKIIFISNKGEKIEVELINNAPYFFEFDLVKKEGMVGNCFDCKYCGREIEESPCNSCDKGYGEEISNFVNRDEDKEKVKLDSEQPNLEEEINEKQICYECKYIEQKPNEYPCYNCINNRTIYNVNNFFEEKQNNETKTNNK